MSHWFWYFVFLPVFLSVSVSACLSVCVHLSVLLVSWWRRQTAAVRWSVLLRPLRLWMPESSIRSTSFIRLSARSRLLFAHLLSSRSILNIRRHTWALSSDWLCKYILNSCIHELIMCAYCGIKAWHRRFEQSLVLICVWFGHLKEHLVSKN